MKRRVFLGSVLAAATCPLLRDAWAAEPKAPELLGGVDAGLGAYLGAGCAGTGKLGAYEAWLRRDVDQMIDFMSWEALSETRDWSMKCWSKAQQKTVVYSLPMLPTGTSDTLADGAAGKFDNLYKLFGAALVARGYGATIIRLGWEFNANWYAWDASKDPKSWAAYWRRIVSILRDVPGASFKFDWCPAAAASGFDAAEAYPGDAHVDIIGMDFYNMPVKNSDDSPEGRWNARMEMQHGLKWHSDFARRHGKPISFPEWGTGVHKRWGGPADDPYFIDHIAAWMSDHKVVYHNYWEYWSKEFDTRLANGRQPGASAAFLRHFGGQRSAGMNMQRTSETGA